MARVNSRSPIKSVAVLRLCFPLIGCLLVGCVMTPRVRNFELAESGDFDKLTSIGTVSVSYDKSIRIHPDSGGLGGTISPSSFVEAVGSSVVRAGLFDSVVAENRADYHLSATVFNVQLVLIDRTLGYVLGYDVVVDWKLQERGAETPLFHEVISSRGRANFGDAFNGITRNTVARERGALKNIETGIRKLAAVTQP